MVKHLPAMWETWVPSLSREDHLEKEMATHSSTLAWKIPQTEEPGRLQSMGLQRVRHDWATSLFYDSCLSCPFQSKPPSSLPWITLKKKNLLTLKLFSMHSYCITLITEFLELNYITPLLKTLQCFPSLLLIQSKPLITVCSFLQGLIPGVSPSYSLLKKLCFPYNSMKIPGGYLSKGFALTTPSFSGVLHSEPLPWSQHSTLIYLKLPTLTIPTLRAPSSTCPVFSFLISI